MPKFKVNIEFEIDTADYINVRDRDDVKELVSELIEGNADWPDYDQIKETVTEIPD